MTKKENRSAGIEELDKEKTEEEEESLSPTNDVTHNRVRNLVTKLLEKVFFDQDLTVTGCCRCFRG